MNLEQRMIRLERQNRWLIALMLFLGVMPWLVGFAPPRRRGQDDEISARRFVVKDNDGSIRGYFGIENNSNNVICGVESGDKNQKAVLRAADEQATISLVEIAGNTPEGENTSAELIITSSGPQLTMTKNTELMVSLNTLAKGEAGPGPRSTRRGGIFIHPLHFIPSGDK